MSEVQQDQIESMRDKATDRRTDTRYHVLSQEEIDTLLSAYESANSEGTATGTHAKERQVRLYDFAKPDRFSKEHLKALESIHESFASELSSELSALYGTPTRVDLVSIDQATYKQYRATVPPKTLLAEVAVPPMISDVLFGVASSIVGIWVDYLCGGNPNLSAAPSNLTPVDIAVARKVIDRIVQMYASVWPGGAAIHPEVRRASDAEYCDEATMIASESVLVCSFELQAGPAIGMMTICMPAIGAEQMMPSVSAIQSIQSTRKQDHDTGEARRAISPVALPCHVILGNATVSLSDLTNFEVGDVLRTSKRAGDEAEFWIGSRHMFNCRPGNHRGNVAVVISGLADEDAPANPVAAQEEALARAA